MVFICLLLSIASVFGRNIDSGVGIMSEESFLSFAVMAALPVVN